MFFVENARFLSLSYLPVHILFEYNFYKRFFLAFLKSLTKYKIARESASGKYITALIPILLVNLEISIDNILQSKRPKANQSSET